MPHFLKTLKRIGRLDSIHVTVGIVGSREIPDVADYINQGDGWTIFAPHLTIYGFEADINACDRMNAALEAKGINWTETHIPLALSDSVGEATIYVTKNPACSSLYPPSDLYRKRFTVNVKDLELDFTETIETTTLDIFCESEGIHCIDVLQVDVQGADLHVLEGSIKTLERGTLAIITEVEFMTVYAQQPLFSDVDVYLRKQGFTLFDFADLHREQRRDIPLVSSRHAGPLYWADAFYFRDLISEDGVTPQKNPEKIFKLACIADAMSFPDYALEVLAYLTVNYGDDRQYNFAAVIIESLSQIPELLALPEVMERGLDSLPIVSRMRNFL